MLWSCSGRSLIILPGISRIKKSFSWLSTAQNAHPVTAVPCHLVDFLSAAFEYRFSSHLIFHVQPSRPAPLGQIEYKVTQNHKMSSPVGSAFQSMYVSSVGVKLKTYEIAFFLVSSFCNECICCYKKKAKIYM